jgi:hypothetical protein
MRVNDAVAGMSVRSLFWFVFSLMVLHLIAYVASAANPYVRADGWFFVTEFLIPFYRGEFDFKDLYHIRSALDHAQPMHRLLMFANAKIFSLDFRYEAVFGALFCVLIALVICLHFIKTHKLLALPKDIAIGLIVLVSVIFSLNSTTTYTWSIVALGYMTQFFIILFFIYLSGLVINRTDRWPGLIALMCIMLFVGDDASMLALIVAVFALSIISLVTRDRYYFKYLILLVATLVTYKVYSASVITMQNPGAEKLDLMGVVTFYIQNWRDLFILVVTPFADSIFHKQHLRFIGDYAGALSATIGLVIFLLHVYAWYAFFRYRLYEKSYLPVFLMLYSYALMAGIFVYRIPGYGVEGLHQPRYVRSYQIGLWGCLWVMLSVYWHRVSVIDNGRLLRRLFLFVSVSLLLTQLALSTHAWKGKKYELAWQDRLGSHILYYGGDQINGVPCPEGRSPLKLCKLKDKNRNKAVGFLKEKQLNVFSDRIRGAYFNPPSR